MQEATAKPSVIVLSGTMPAIERLVIVTVLQWQG